MFPTFVTILPLTIPANYRLSSQFLLVGLKVGVRVWLMQKYLFATVWYCKSVRYGMYRKIQYNLNQGHRLSLGITLRVEIKKNIHNII